MTLTRPRLIAAISLALAVATFVILVRVIGCGFIEYDDNGYITENLRVQRGVTFDNVGWALTAKAACNWHPLTLISHMLDCTLFGTDARGHHLVNLLFHVANVVLLFLLLARMTGGVWPSALAAALFAWHPLHVESVAWVSERKDVLSTCLLFMALLAYVRYARTLRWRDYVLVFVLLALGLSAKLMLVTTPFVMLLLDFWPLRRLVAGGWLTGENRARFARVVLEKVPLLALAAGASVLAFVYQHQSGTVSSLDELPAAVRVANAAVAYGRYLEQTVWPAGLTIFYPHPKDTLTALQIGGFGLLLAAITAVAIWQWRRRPYLAVGWFWYLGTLVPVIGLVQIGGQAISDHFTYVPLIGVFMMIAWVGAELVGRGAVRRAVFAGAAAAVLLVLAVSSWIQVGHWRDTESVFGRAIEVTDRNHVAHAIIGIVHLRNHRLDEAMAQLSTSLRIEPAYNLANANLGFALALTGRLDEAIVHYRRALRSRPDDPETRNNLGVALARKGDLEAAITQFEAALMVNPDLAKAHHNLGRCFVTKGDFDRALTFFAEALRLQPDLFDAHNDYARALVQADRLEEAVARFGLALRIRPDAVDVLDNLGRALEALGRTQQALVHYRKAIRLAPDGTAAEIRQRLARVLTARGEHAEAIAIYRQIVEKAPDDPAALVNLSAALAAAGRFEEAVIKLREALRHHPDEFDAHYNLGSALRRQGELTEALTHFRHAVRVRPDSVPALYRLSWGLATHPDAEARRPREAIRIAQRAANLTGYQQPQMLDALAAAYAADGQYEKAVELAESAAALARQIEQTKIADGIDARLERYRRRQPYREGDGP